MKKIKYIEAYNNGYKIIDLSDAYEYKKSHLKNSINISYDDLIMNYRNYLNKNEKYYFYCNNVVKSKRAVIILEYLGYEVTMVEK